MRDHRLIPTVHSLVQPPNIVRYNQDCETQTHLQLRYLMPDVFTGYEIDGRKALVQKDEIRLAHEY